MDTHLVDEGAAGRLAVHVLGTVSLVGVDQSVLKSVVILGEDGRVNHLVGAQLHAGQRITDDHVSGALPMARSPSAVAYHTKWTYVCIMQSNVLPKVFLTLCTNTA